MADRILTIVLKGDGSGLTGTLRAAESQVQRFGTVLDTAGKRAAGMGHASRGAATDVAALGKAHATTAAQTRALASNVTMLRGTLATLGVSYVAREWLQAGLAMDRLERSTAAALGSQSAAARELRFVREQAERLGIYFPTLAEGYSGLAAATRGTVLAGQQTREIFLAVAEAGRAMNLSNDRITGTLTALQQIAGKGTVSMEELRQQLGDRLPGAMQIAARAMEMPVAEFVKMVAEGRLLSSEFLPKFAREMRNAAAAGVELARTSPAAEFERLRNAIFDLAQSTSRGGTLNVLGAGAGALARNLAAVATAAGVVAVALAGAFAGRQLQRLQDYAGGVMAARREMVASASAAMASAQAKAADTAATLAAIQASRTQATAELSVANAEIATAQQTIRATEATSFLSASRRQATIATEQLHAAERRRNAALGTLAALGQQQARVERDAVGAAQQLEGAQRSLNASQVTAIGVMRRVGTGIASLGRGLLAFAGGPVGIVITGVALLAAAFVNASAKAKQLKEDVQNAITMSQMFQGSKDLDDALSAGKELLARREELKADIAGREANLAQIRLNPIARGTDIYRDRQAELQHQRNALAEVNRQLEINARLIPGLVEKQAALGAQVAASTDEGVKFNEEMAKQNESLKVARIEREQGVRAALEYQAMKAAEVTSVDQLSQATRDLIDTQVRETVAAEEWKEAQEAATRASRESAKATEDQKKARREHADVLAQARAELAGPLAQAQVAHAQAIARLDTEYAAHNITLGDYIGLKEVEDEKLRRTTAQLAAEADVLGQTREYYEQQIRLSGLSAAARRVEEEVQQRVNDAIRAGHPLSAQQVEDLRAFIAVSQQQIDFNEASQRAAEDFQYSWLNAVRSVGNAIGDWMTGTISSWKDFGRTLVDIAKRWGSDLISQGFEWLVNGGFAGAGRQQGAGGGGIGGWLSALAGREGFLGGIARAFGFQPGAAGASGMGWGNAAVSTLGGGAGFLAMPAGAGASPFTAAGAAQAMGGGAGGMSYLGMLANSNVGKFLQSGAAPWLGAAAGALYGFNSTDDGLGKGLAGAAYGVAGYGITAGVGAGLAASAAGAGAGAAATAGLAAIPVAGWIALAAIAIDKLSGGKLFGTKFKVESGENEFTYGDGAFTGSQEITKVRQRSLFRGRKWTTEAGDIGDEARDALSQAHAAISDAVAQAAAQLGVTAPALLAATFKQEFDGKGNLKREFGEIAGRTYREAQDAFQQRYLAENLLAVAGMAGHADTIDELANRYRGTAAALTDFSTLMLAIAADAKAGALLWEDTDEALTNAVATLEALRGTGESLAKTYERVVGGARQYGQLIAGVRGELLTRDLSDFARAQLDVELQYRAQVKSANELAKALGLSGARAEDLAAIEQLRAVRMADLQQQMERQRDEFLGNLRLSELGPGTDRSKLADAMGQLQAAVAAGDMQRAQQLSQTALGFGRNLFASGADYNALYGQVTGLLQQLDPADSGLTIDALQQLADTMETLPNDIAAALFGLLQGQTPTPPPPAPGRPGLPDRPRNPKLDRDPTNKFGRGNDALLERMASGIDTLVRQVEQRDTSDRLRQRNERGALVR